MARQSSTSSESSPQLTTRLPRDLSPSSGASPYHPLPVPYHTPFTPHSTWPTSTRSGSNSAFSNPSSSRASPGFPSSSVRPSPRLSQAREDPPASTSAERRQKGKDADEDDFVRDFVRLNRPDEGQLKSFMGKSSGLPLLWSAMGFKYGENSARCE